MADWFWEISHCARSLSKVHDQLWEEQIGSSSTTQTNFIKQHCEIVARISILIAKSSGIELSVADRNLLICGALAHDIGTYAVLHPHNVATGTEPIFQRELYIQHGVLGYQLLRERGFEESLAQFARNHTGVGISRADIERQHLALPPADYLAQTPLQEVVMLADKFHTKSIPPKFVSKKTARARCEKFGAENLARWDKLVSGHYAPSRDELQKLADEYGMELI